MMNKFFISLNLILAVFYFTTANCARKITKEEEEEPAGIAPGQMAEETERRAQILVQQAINIGSEDRLVELQKKYGFIKSIQEKIKDALDKIAKGIQLQPDIKAMPKEIKEEEKFEEKPLTEEEKKSANTVFWDAIYANNLKMAEMALKSGADVNNTVSTYSMIPYTALQFAIINDNIPLIDLLFRYGVASPEAIIQIISIGWLFLHEPGLQKFRKSTSPDLLLQVFKKLLETTKIKNINQPVNGEIPLIVAMEKEADPGIIKLLIDHGADVNIQDDQGRTPLFFAHNPEYVKLLIDHKANVNARNQSGQTPIFRAAPETVRLLVQAGADINAQDNEGNTALLNNMFDPERIIALLESGANPDIPNKNNETFTAKINEMEYKQARTAYFSKYQKGLAKKIETETKLPKEISKIVAGYTEAQLKDPTVLLWHSMENNQLDRVREAIINGADINSQSTQYSGYTPLMWAIAKNNLPLIKLLLKHRANMQGALSSLMDYDNVIPGMTVREEIPHIKLVMEILELLFKNKPDVDEINRSLNISNNAQILRYLLDHGAEVEATDSFGRTPLFFAQNDETLKLLLGRKANVNARDQSGQTPIMSANQAVLSILVNNGADINARDNMGNTALMNSIYDPERIIALLEAGADVNIANNHGETFLSLIKYKGTGEKEETSGEIPIPPTPGMVDSLELARKAYAEFQNRAAKKITAETKIIKEVAKVISEYL